MKDQNLDFGGRMVSRSLKNTFSFVSRSSLASPPPATISLVLSPLFPPSQTR